VNPTTYAALLEEPITSDELITALGNGARHKATGFDGISLEFYTANWEAIRTELLQLNHMFLHKNNSRRQKQGIAVCLNKSTSSHTPDDYRPISLLATEYKLLARILAHRLRHILTHRLQNSQFCGVPGNSILDAIYCVRDVLAHAETTGTPSCILTLDFQQAFDSISHQYLFQILHSVLGIILLYFITL
jgi:hypothetical protein